MQKEINKGKDRALSPDEIVDAIQLAFPNLQANREKQKEYVKALIGFSSLIKHEKQRIKQQKSDTSPHLKNLDVK